LLEEIWRFHLSRQEEPRERDRHIFLPSHQVALGSRAVATRRSPDSSTASAMFRPNPLALPVTNHTLFINSYFSSLHLLPGFRSSEHCPQLGGCRPFPRSEGSIERIRILVAEQKCHFRYIHLRPVEVLVRQFLPRLKKQLPEVQL
jgi:hypothetical protein